MLQYPENTHQCCHLHMPALGLISVSPITIVSPMRTTNWENVRLLGLLREMQDYNCTDINDDRAADGTDLGTQYCDAQQSPSAINPPTVSIPIQPLKCKQLFPKGRHKIGNGMSDLDPLIIP